MPNPSIVSPIIGASLTQVWKPALDGINPVGSYYDRFAPFALGMTLNAAPSAAGGRDMATFCRISANLAAGATAGISNGVSAAPGAGNTYTNDTGQALVIGDYCFLTAPVATTP